METWLSDDRNFTLQVYNLLQASGPNSSYDLLYLTKIACFCCEFLHQFPCPTRYGIPTPYAKGYRALPLLTFFCRLVGGEPGNKARSGDSCNISMFGWNEQLR